MSETVGRLVARARKAAGLSLRGLGERVGLSIPFLHDAEHGRRRIPPARWPAFVAALPTLTIRDFAEAALSTGPVEIDASLLTKGQRAALIDALASQATAAA